MVHPGLASGLLEPACFAWAVPCLTQGFLSLIPLVSSTALEPPEVHITPQSDLWLHGETG